MPEFHIKPILQNYHSTVNHGRLGIYNNTVSMGLTPGQYDTAQFPVGPVVHRWKAHIHSGEAGPSVGRRSTPIVEEVSQLSGAARTAASSLEPLENVATALENETTGGSV